MLLWGLDRCRNKSSERLICYFHVIICVLYCTARLLSFWISCCIHLVNNNKFKKEQKRLLSDFRQVPSFHSCSFRGVILKRPPFSESTYHLIPGAVVCSVYFRVTIGVLLPESPGEVPVLFLHFYPFGAGRKIWTPFSGLEIQRFTHKLYPRC